MMKSILEALFEGELSPAGMITPDTPEYHQVNNEIVQLTQTWQKKLPENDYQSLEELLELINQSNMMEAAASFSYGFRLCVALLVDALTDRGELVRKE
jgi:ATP-dependent protease ClpP protease subunit